MSLETETVACHEEGCSSIERPISRELSRYKLDTGVSVRLLEGEIENLMDISSDGKYAILLLDDNGQIDMISTEYQNISIEDRPLNFRYAILEIETGQILYEIATRAESDWGDYWYEGLTPSHTIAEAYSVWGSMRAGAVDSLYYIGNDSFIFSQRAEDFTVTHQLIQVHEGILETEIGRPLFLSHDTNFIVQIGQNGDEYEIQRFDLRHNQVQTILRLEGYTNTGGSRYRFAGSPIEVRLGAEPNTMEIQLYHENTNESLLYTIRMIENS